MNDRVIAEIDLQAIQNNILAVKDKLGKNVKIMSILKANAYGHGSVKVAKFTENIIDYIAVATLEEGVLLRKHGIKKPILVLGETDKNKLLIAEKYDVMTTIFSSDILEKYLVFAKKHSLSIKIHLKIDSGMNRIGIRYDDFDTIYKIFTSPYIKVDGIFSHLSKAKDANFTTFQRTNFENAIKYLVKNNISVPMRHISNSEGCNNPNNFFDCVRIGIAQYIPKDKNCYPAMTLKAKIVQINYVNIGESVGYDLAYTAAKSIRVATVAIGYADGLSHNLSRIGKVILHNKICNIVGNVCMDFTMIDISLVDCAKVGDYVTIFGKEKITANYIAKISKTISYEVLTRLSERVKKVYKP